MEEESIFIAGRIYQRIIEEYNIQKIEPKLITIEHGVGNSVNIQEVIRLIAKKIEIKFEITPVFHLIPLPYGASFVITIDFS